ncbi:MAG TPA: hypothetical protein DCP67_06180, partial [Planctomycetaceae bacterium]|nr:hypothetical protein [Planctomycetaceae bacterium]
HGTFEIQIVETMITQPRTFPVKSIGYQARRFPGEKHSIMLKHDVKVIRPFGVHGHGVLKHYESWHCMLIGL